MSYCSHSYDGDEDDVGDIENGDDQPMAGGLHIMMIEHRKKTGLKLTVFMSQSFRIGAVVHDIWQTAQTGPFSIIHLF